MVAYKEANGTSNAIATSKSVYCTPKGGKYGNPTAIKKVKKTISVKAGKTKKLKPKLKKSKKLRSYTAKFRYESTKPEVATVNEDGVITGLKKGKSTIYVYAQNGVCKKVKVKVK